MQIVGLITSVCYSSAFTNHFRGSLFIPRGRSCCLDVRSALRPSHLCGHFRTFQSTHRRFCERELCPHTEGTCGDEFVRPAHLLSTESVWPTAFLFGAIRTFRSHIHQSVRTARSADLPDWLVTWLSQTRQITTTPGLAVSRENIKVEKIFSITLVAVTMVRSVCYIMIYGTRL